MASAGEEKFLRCMQLLNEGSLFIAKEVLKREIRLTGRDLNKLLQEKRRKIIQQFQNPKQREILFPPSGQTDVEEWDVSLLTGVLLILFESSLSAADKQAIKDIRYQRNNIFAHTATACLSDDNYREISNKLKDAFDTLASGFSSEIQQYCTFIGVKCLYGALDRNSHVEQLKHLSQIDIMSMLREIFSKIDTTKETRDENERRIILLGQRLSDKAPIGNALLGRQVFNDSRGETELKCQVERGLYRNSKYTIVNTPELPRSDLDDSLLEVQRSLKLCPKPHAFLLIINSDDQNTEVEKYMPDILRVTFGEDIFLHCIIVHVNKCRDGAIFMKRQDNLSKLARKCNDRITVISDTHLLSTGENDAFVNELTKLIEKVSENGRRFYLYKFIDDHRKILSDHFKSCNQNLTIQEELSVIVTRLSEVLSPQVWTKYLVGGTLFAVGLGVAGLGLAVVAGPVTVVAAAAGWVVGKFLFR